MKLTIEQSVLDNNLQAVSRAVPSKPSQAILGCVLVEADQKTGNVSLTAFDLSMGIKTTFKATVEEGGSMAVNAKLFFSIVSRIQPGPIGIVVEEQVEITTKSGKYKLPCLSADEFPALPLVTSKNSLQISAQDLISGMRGTVFSASTDETKQVLTGVHVLSADESLEFGATDGHRLSVITTPCGESEGFSATIPASSLKALEQTLGNWPEVVTVHHEQGQVVFSWDNYFLTTRTLDGNYPNYQQLIPRQFERHMTVERKPFISSLDRVMLLADPKYGTVKISLNQDTQEVTLSSEGQDIGSCNENIPVQISGDSMELALNGKYLMEGLKSMGAANVQFQINSSTAPMIITPLGGTKATYLIMPIQIRA